MPNLNRQTLQLVFVFLFILFLRVSHVSAGPLDVPFFSQQDQDWSTHPLGQALEGQTVGVYGCGVTSGAMVVSYYKGETVTPKELNDALKHAGDFSDALLKWDAANWAQATNGVIQGIANLKPWSEVWVKKSPKAILIENVELGRPAIVYLGNAHYVVVTKYDAQNAKFLINDPWKGDDDGVYIPFEQNAKGLGLNSITQIVLLYTSAEVPPNVDGAMREKYTALGGVRGTLGAPLESAQPYDFSNGQRGSKQRFEFGSIFALPNAQAIWMPTFIADVYAKHQEFGLPLRDAYSAPMVGSTLHARVDFEHGSIVHAPGAAQADLFTDEKSFRAEYFSNLDLSGAPTLTRVDQDILFDWGPEAPAPNLPRDNWSARWSGTVDVGLPTANFYVAAEGRVRLRVDDKLIINDWQTSTQTVRSSIQALLPGKHRITLEYGNDSGNASVRFGVFVPGINPVFAAETWGAPDSQPEAAPARTAPTLNTFDPNRVVCNNWFVTNHAASANEIQAMLNAAGTDLARYTDASTGLAASQIIANAIAAYPVNGQYYFNPQLLLVKMETESSTIWGRNRTALDSPVPLKGQVVGTLADWILFYGWPDDPNRVDLTKKGFANQVQNAVRILTTDFADLIQDGVGRNGWNVGVAYPRAIDEITVTPANAATAALYIYTPHVYNDKKNIFAIWQQHFAGTPCDDSIVPTQPPLAAVATYTVLTLDVSGSMAASDPSGKSKIEALKDAATSLLDMIQSENTTQGAQHQVAVITFSNGGSVDLPLTTDIPRAMEIINGLAPLDGTNIGDGLTRANAELASIPPNAPRFVLLLSDGLPTVSYTGTRFDADGLKEEILQGPVRDAAQNKNCIYTIGFGDPNQDFFGLLESYDPEFLQQIANESGCGKAYEAKDASALANVYIQFRHQTLGNVIGQFTGEISQGQTVYAGDVNVAPSQDTLYLTLNWPGSRLELDVTDPQGTRVSSGYQGANITTTSRLVYMIIQKPIPGTWRINVFGAEIPEQTTQFNTIVSTRTGTVIPTTDNNVALVLVLTFALLGGGFLMALILTHSTPSHAAQLHVVKGTANRPRVLVTRSVKIGRDPTCQIMFASDTQISRVHAEIRREPAGYFVYDMQSRNGTFVNGQRIMRHQLKHGDQIIVGQSTLVFMG